MNKYELTSESKIWCGVKLFRIRALKSIPEINVKVGDLGGWIESEKNLSQDGNCWIFHEAIVYGNAEVYGNAKVSGNANVFGNAYVFGNAVVCGNAKVFGDAVVCGNAYVFGNANVFGYAQVFGNAVVKHKFSTGVCVNICTEPYSISYSGFDEKGVHYVSVGCQDHSIENWLDEKYRNTIINENKFPKEKIQSFLNVLNVIIDLQGIDITKNSENNLIQKSTKQGRDPVTGRFLKKSI